MSLADMSGFLDRFTPGRCVQRITEIDCESLQAAGVEAILLDLDNTLLPWQSLEVPDDVRSWITRAKECGLKLVVLSNTHNPKRLNTIADELGIASIPRALKPRKVGFSRATELIGCSPQKTVVVGDQLLTDILGGNLSGMATILVRPMHRREFVGTKLSRMVERVLLAMLNRRGSLGTKSGRIQSDTQDIK